jgi:glycine/D-amino acid oxidase-like deaminating enzyme/nitrite reductase/ring-hydroxylating ferredoxin subunit
MDHVTKHSSIWIDTAPVPNRAALAQDVDVDVCIVGGGICGITAARILKRAGMTVAVVEALSIGGGETGHTTAHLATHHDLYYKDIISKFGEDEARLVLESRRSAIAQIEEFVTEEGISCHYERVPAYLFTERSSDARELEEEFAACQRIGMHAEWVESMPTRFPITGAIRFPNQAQFHPLEYLRGLAERVSGNGCHIFEHARVTNIDYGSPCRVYAEGGTITCKHVILATNSPVNATGLLITKIAAYRTYAMAFRIDPASAPLALLWDTSDPYHYVRVHRSGDATFLIVGGEDHKVGSTENSAPTDNHNPEDAAWQRIEGWTRGRFVVGEVAAKWSGQILEPADGLPYIGKYDDHAWVATGFSGDGMTNGTMAAMLLSREILGERPALSRIYDSKRMPTHGAGEYVRENVDYPKHLITDRVKRADTGQFRTVTPGEGKIVRMGKQKLAVFRDNDGSVHAFSPVCTHMGCHVHWNNAESSWDCPCHGSRFDARTGEPLNGPATVALEAKDVTSRPSATPEQPMLSHNLPRDTRPSFVGVRDSRTSLA